MKKRTLSPIKRPHGLISPSASGVAAEARVAAELLRCALKVAKPFWTDDEVDLLVLHPSTDSLIPVPIQVKSVQFIPRTNGRQAKSVFIKGLKKKYLERQPGLCLAIYRPDKDWIWFIDSAATIKKVYDAQNCDGGKPKYADLRHGSDVRIRVMREGDPILDEWKVSPDNAIFLTEAIRRVLRLLANPELRILSLRDLFQEAGDEE
jgi:hypothetical protein